ncbi:hypothetical protein N7516_008920 [Penicillium verrucosum]|uniref:uncharacterized protein n=1 Tax=Penicillium verrucosum TaxID=60171 RepID=UPI0025457616|nr:uncharacterized protein N7516_008920 [Penicillium verrucosum]KAJ5927147.1 hypothetical protein N7516_008920 [Penicillium verrucosum]
MTNASEASAKHFVANILPLYQGPSVKLRIQPSNQEYIISKSLLCAESPVFSKMFNGEFLESQQQTATLEETEDDVSTRSLEALVQWLYQRTVRFGIEDPGEHISAAMELARLADKYDIVGLETIMAEYIKNILKHNPHPQNNSCWRHVDSNTYYLTHNHIASAILLPREHPVRSVVAAASVEGFLRSANPKFSEEIHAYPSFGADLLQETRLILHRVKPLRAATFKDPISGERSELNSNVFY